MKDEEKLPHIKIEIDKLYQDEAIKLLGSFSVGQVAEVNFLDGKYVAQVLLEKSKDGPEEFEKAQFELVYGDPATDYHVRPNIVSAEVLSKFLSEIGFRVEPTDNQDNNSDDIERKLIVEKVQDIDVGSINMTGSGLPEYTDNFYPITRNEGVGVDRSRIRSLYPSPLVLNIGSGSDEAKQLPHAINVDISKHGNPDVIASGYNLPFRDGSFTVVTASHVLEHFTLNQIQPVLKEWLRVLHPKGVLRIAVPDGGKALKELQEGVTSKNLPSYALPGGSAPLTQLLGLGGENSNTDPRWRHQILFSAELLIAKLRSAGLVDIEPYREDEALSYLSEVDTDETNSYSLRLEALRKREPHKVFPEIKESEYQKLKVIVDWSRSKSLSILVPVNNEQKNLPSFIKNLDATVVELDSLGIDHEVIFILNGCNDHSLDIVNNYIVLKDPQKIKYTESATGIMHAFRKGLRVRNKKGYVSKIDVDTDFHYWTLPLMIRELLSDDKKQVTYAEVRPMENSPNRFNMGEFYQDFRTTRLYYHGRFSLYRSSPFDFFPEELIDSSGILAEDMVLSALYAYYFGLDSMGPAVGAYARSAQPTSFDVNIRKFDRCRTEIEKIERAFPQLRILSSVLKRVATLPESGQTADLDYTKEAMWLAYHDLHEAMTKISRLQDGVTGDASEWGRLR